MVRHIHRLSRMKGRMITVNLSVLEEDEMEAIIFGSDRSESAEAAVSQARSGLLFLREISALPPNCQERLMGFIHPQNPKGPDDVFLVSTSSADLWALQRVGKFRKDFNLRVRTHHIHMPPLRERAEDIPLLVEHFMEKASRKLGKKKPTPPRELLTLLGTYAFPGNVRELEDMVTDAVDAHQARVLSLDRFKARMNNGEKSWVAKTSDHTPMVSPFHGLDQLPTIRESTQMLIDEAMRRSGGNQSIAARMLGISQPALSKRLKGSD